MPSTRFQYLAAGTRYVDQNGAFTQPFRVYWQEFIDALDGALTDIEGNITDITNILVRLGLVEVLADGTFVIVDQGLNADGSVKPNKVLTESVQAEAITGPLFETGPTTAIPSSGAEVTVFTSSVKPVGDATFGSANVFIMGQFDGTSNPDSAADFYLETNSNGAGWVRRKTAKAGARTNGADTYSYQTIYTGFALSAVGLLTVQARIIAKAIAMPGSSVFASSILEPGIQIVPGKR